MKLRVQIIENFDEYVESVRKNSEDSLMYPDVCDMVINYTNYNIPDETINGYRIFSKSESPSNTKSVGIYSDIDILTVDYTDEVLEELDRIMEIKNTQFYNNYK